ncbi:MAG: hypothetical protein AVDCRST_MAG12-2998, partial [uncultured Rubrobacteraceae bacterium]
WRASSPPGRRGSAGCPRRSVGSSWTSRGESYGSCHQPQT